MNLTHEQKLKKFRRELVNDDHLNSLCGSKKKKYMVRYGYEDGEITNVFVLNNADWALTTTVRTIVGFADGLDLRFIVTTAGNWFGNPFENQPSDYILFIIQ